MLVAQKDNFLIDTDPSKLNVEFIHNYLSHSYWAKDRTKETVQKSINGSLNFGLYHNEQQIGFARVITDGIIMAYIMDVFVSPEFQGQGTGTWFMSSLLKFEAFRDVRKWILVTKDAEEFYRRFGFNEFNPVNRNWMEMET